MGSSNNAIIRSDKVISKCLQRHYTVTYEILLHRQIDSKNFVDLECGKI